MFLPRFASAICTQNYPIPPSNVPSHGCKIRSSLARVDLCFQNHASASITARRESSPSLHGSSWSCCRPPAASRKSTAVLYREYACCGDEVRENVAIVYLAPVAHVRAPLAALIGQIGVVLEGDTCFIQFLLISLLAVLIQGLKVATHGSPRTTGKHFCPPRGVTSTSKRTCLLAADHV